MKNNVIYLLLIFCFSSLLLGQTTAISYFKQNNSQIEWRIFNPYLNEDFIFLKFDSKPTNVTFYENQAYYIIDNSIMNVHLQRNSQPSIIAAEIPNRSKDSKILINDQGNKIFYGFTSPISNKDLIFQKKDQNQKNSEKITYMGKDYEYYNRGGGEFFLLKIYKYDIINKRWLESKSLITGMHYFYSPWSAVEDFLKKFSSKMNSDLIRSMYSYAYRTKKFISTDGEKEHYSMQSKYSENIIFDIFELNGDFSHITPPFGYFNLKENLKKIIYDGKTESDHTIFQIVFEEKDNFLLIESEFDGEYAQVINLETGNIIKKMGPGTYSAVWIDNFK